MTGCNSAFMDLANRMDDILEANFNMAPRGDKERVNKVADLLMKMIINGYYSLTWVNTLNFIERNPSTEIHPENIEEVEEASQSKHLSFYYNRAVKSFEKWVGVQKFQTCRFCSSCGGDYPSYGGEGVMEGSWGYWMRYGDRCTGDLSAEKKPSQLCCSID